MKALTTPWGVWTWRGTALVVVLMLAPLLATLGLGAHGDGFTTALHARGLLVGTVLLAAGVLLHLHWRITANTTTGWLALLLAVAAVPAVTLGAFTLAHPRAVQAQAAWLVGSSRAGDDLARASVVTVLTCILAAALSQLAELPPWARVRAVAGVLVLGLGSAVGGMVALATGLVGAALLTGTAAALLLHAIETQQRRIDALDLQVRTDEVRVRQEHARLHEINATVAGIASAQKLMAEGLTADGSNALASMMRAEVDRLQRLVADRGPTRRRSVDLDDTIGQIVLSHLARGRVVIWEPTGIRAMGRSDEIAEVVNVLLETAAVHGGPDAVSVRVSRDVDGQGVTITVSDQGPGVAPELRDRIFDWGISRSGSPGQGIGLHVAADIARQLGGGLELVPGTTGASFALHLAAAPAEVSAGEHVA
jgi:signal transduction histidine kinase